MLSIALRAPVAITKASNTISIPWAKVTVRATGSTARTVPVTGRTPANVVTLGRIGTLSGSRQPRMTHGKVKPRKCEKSSSTTVISRSSRATLESASSLITLRPPIPAPRTTSCFFAIPLTLFLYFVFLKGLLRTCADLISVAVAPLRGRHRAFDRFDMQPASGPRRFAADAATHGITHGSRLRPGPLCVASGTLQLAELWCEHQSSDRIQHDQRLVRGWNAGKDRSENGVAADRDQGTATRLSQRLLAGLMGL